MKLSNLIFRTVLAGLLTLPVIYVQANDPEWDLNIHRDQVFGALDFGDEITTGILEVFFGV